MSKHTHTIDWLTVVLYLLLIAIGWAAVFTANYNPEVALQSVADWHIEVQKQSIIIAICLLVAFVIQVFDTRFYTTFAYFFYGLAILLLLVVFGVGSEISGSKSWIKLGFFNMQPAEFAKTATCLALAKYLSTPGVSMRRFNQMLAGIAIIGFPMFIIVLQNETGSALVYAAMFLVLYRAGWAGGYLLVGFLAIALFVLSLVSNFYYIMAGLSMLVLVVLLINKKTRRVQTVISYLVPVAIVGSLSLLMPQLWWMAFVLVVILILLFMVSYTKETIYAILALVFACSVYVKGVDYAYNNLLAPYQQNRIGVILGTIDDNKGAGYNLDQSLIAIGSGRVWGKGYLQGTQNKGKFVPELSTDFIFCTIGEEFGFVGSLLVISLLVMLMLRVIRLAEKQQSKLSLYYGYGVVCIIFFHFTVNIGMTIGLMPVIGIPLPFISYGGSGMLGFTILLFLFLKLDSERSLYIQ